MTHAVVKEAEDKMKKALEAMQHDFARIRTGRANPMVLEPITVDYYGVQTPITQVATVSVPEPRQLLLAPYDKSMVGTIERAILASDLGVNPNNDGQSIRLIFPEMTEERRKDLVKQVNHRTEEGCVSVRHARREALDQLKSSRTPRPWARTTRSGSSGRSRPSPTSTSSTPTSSSGRKTKS
jgi:ribosome recycling factor